MLNTVPSTLEEYNMLLLWRKLIEMTTMGEGKLLCQGQCEGRSIKVFGCFDVSAPMAFPSTLGKYLPISPDDGGSSDGDSIRPKNLLTSFAENVIFQPAQNDQGKSELIR